MAKLSQKHFNKNMEKSLNAKTENNNKEFSSIADRKINTNLCYDGGKSFVILQIQSRRYRGPCPHFGLQKILFFRTSCND